MLLDMVARLGTALLATVSAYDLMTRSLSLPLKILVHGTILTVVSSLVLSIVLKRWIAPHKEVLDDAEDPSTAASLPVGLPADDDVKPEDPTSDESTFDAEMTMKKDSREAPHYTFPPSPMPERDPQAIRRAIPKVRRNLMADFDRFDQEEM